MKDHAADDRGQVGIGTLIVFIAMVLVAAIAAGVLINTAGFLQSSSEATGQGASDATSNRLQVVSATGSDLDNDAVGIVDILVKRGPGAGNVDLSTMTIQWIGPSGSFYQLAGTQSGNPDGYFAIEAVQDTDGSLPVLNDQEDRLRIRLELGENDGETILGDDKYKFGNELGEGESATVRITTSSGSQTTEEILVPKTISGTSAVQL
nr:archaellin/type IV pilin N-terminal domain-containing protein [Halomicroarcula laminariae]